MTNPAPANKNPTLTITLGLHNQLAIVRPNGELCSLRKGYAEQVILRLLRGQSKAQATQGTPQYIPSYEYDAIAMQARKFTQRGREIFPNVSLSDLGL